MCIDSHVHSVKIIFLWFREKSGVRLESNFLCRASGCSTEGAIVHLMINNKE
jgi:hypothetical protein